MAWTDEVRRLANAKTQQCMELTRCTDGMANEIEALWCENSLLHNGKKEANTRLATPILRWMSELQERVTDLELSSTKSQSNVESS